MFNLFALVQRVIDLCAAPGSWSQVCAKKLTEQGLFKQANQQSVRIIAVDLQEMAPIDNVIEIQGDITKQQTVDEILESFQGNRAEMVISDGAPDVTGFHDMDQYIQSQLIVAALNISNLTLKPHGNFVAKIFKGTDITFLYSQFKLFFNSVYIIKPGSSRASSVEYFIVCLDYQPPLDFTKELALYTFSPELQLENVDQTQVEQKEVEQVYFQFITCGDLSGFDNFNGIADPF